ncbi:hypothetical protein DUI87_20046 [Hirundo rustica rustica]|uniref:Uncharacterized protein n=1 Tax=Hirundo rustica rustica TaxID=333673 RepID=A0A3M0JUQ1_HIRRU|nr:hypothetical protein DUI87_20046 [Hirundo rustica rustica]
MATGKGGSHVMPLPRQWFSTTCLTFKRWRQKRQEKVKDPEVHLADCLRAILTTMQPGIDFPRCFEVPGKCRTRTDTEFLGTLAERKREAVNGVGRVSGRGRLMPSDNGPAIKTRLWMMEPEHRNSMALKNASDIANSVVEDGLEGGGISFCSAMSSPDQKEGSNAHSFSADE